MPLPALRRSWPLLILPVNPAGTIAAIHRMHYYRYLFLDWINYARNHGCHPRQVSSAHQDGARPQGADRLNVGWTIWLRGTTQNPQAPVAQLDRAPDFESGGQGFESLPARQISLSLIHISEPTRRTPI